MKKTLDKIINNRDENLRRLIGIYLEKGLPGFPTVLKKYFSAAREHPEEFRNHERILAISIGGSNVKVMLASMENGAAKVEKVVSRQNPGTMTEFEDYFDGLLLSEKLFEEYLRGGGETCIGFSIAVGIKDGVPMHDTKIPCVRNLVARDFERDAATHHLGRNLESYFRSRGIKPPGVIYEGDCPLAHLGAVVMSGLKPDEPSFLSICGTGMASANDDFFMLFGSEGVLDDDDPELMPPEETENCQLQYCVAGKGLYGVMRRAIAMKSREPDSVLGGLGLEKYFASSADSKNVSLIWETATGGEAKGAAAEIRNSVSPEAFTELRDLSVRIMDKAVSAFTTNTLASLVHMTIQNPARDIRIFTEGSVALNQAFYERFALELKERVSDPAIYDETGVPQPPMPVLIADPRKILKAESASDSEIKEVDITIIGAMALAIADKYLDRASSRA